LDVLNALEPSMILGGEDTSISDDIMKRQLMGGNTKANHMNIQRQGDSSLRPGSHTEAVMALSWNPIHKQVIASGSSDTTVKLWDVTKNSAEANAATFRHHRGKVQSVCWHPKEGTLLATGAYDRKIALLDARSSNDNTKFVKVQSDCEAITWDPFHPEHLVVATEDGKVLCWDVRKFDTSTPLWTLIANEYGGITDVSFSPHVPGLFATSSVDKTIMLWDSYAGNSAPIQKGSPNPCGSKDMCAGKLFSVDFYPSAPLLLACGGSGNILSLWSLESEEAVKRNFGSRLENIGMANNDDEVADKEAPKQEDFEAMMASDRGKEQEMDQKEKKKKKVKGKKGKKKAHKRGA